MSSTIPQLVLGCLQAAVSDPDQAEDALIAAMDPLHPVEAFAFVVELLSAASAFVRVAAKAYGNDPVAVINVMEAPE